MGHLSPGSLTINALAQKIAELKKAQRAMETLGMTHLLASKTNYSNITISTREHITESAAPFKGSCF